METIITWTKKRKLHQIADKYEIEFELKVIPIGDVTDLITFQAEGPYLEVMDFYDEVNDLLPIQISE